MKKFAIVILIELILFSFPVSGIFPQDFIFISDDDISSNLPSNFNWRDIDGVDFTTPIRDQSPFPSCETFAILAAVETMVQFKVGYPFGCDLSEAHLYFFSGGNLNWGSYPENDTQFLQDFGVPDEACWPYPTEFKQYLLNTTSPDWKNRTVKISNWSYLPEDSNSIKSALINNGPVPTYFMVYDDFVYHKDGIYRHRWGKYRGIHYITIVGYNDNPGYWICKNSWGTEYQDEGWFNIGYGECSIEKKSFYITGVYGQFPIIFVDDDNIIGPWDGSQEYPYLKIQQGINNSYEGYTVFVKNGLYNENIVISKTINLYGENRDNTIIDGGGISQVITVTSPNIRISNFTIQNSGKDPFEAGIKTLSLNSNITIINNIIQNNGIGVFLNYAYEQSWNIVNDNIIQNNNDGLYVHWANNNQILGNKIQFNQDDGIEMESSRNSQIINNVIQENGKYGLYLRAASHRNYIKSNDFVNNNNHAFFDGSLFNNWLMNYWSDSICIILKPIKGQLDIYDIPWIDFDFFPSLKMNNF